MHTVELSFCHLLQGKESKTKIRLKPCLTHNRFHRLMLDSHLYTQTYTWTQPHIDTQTLPTQSQKKSETEREKYVTGCDPCHSGWFNWLCPLLVFIMSMLTHLNTAAIVRAELHVGRAQHQGGRPEGQRKKVGCQMYTCTHAFYTMIAWKCKCVVGVNWIWERKKTLFVCRLLFGNM